jgi:hypothetical protein
MGPLRSAGGPDLFDTVALQVHGAGPFCEGAAARSAVGPAAITHYRAAWQSARLLPLNEVVHRALNQLASRRSASQLRLGQPPVTKSQIRLHLPGLVADNPILHTAHLGFPRAVTTRLAKLASA